MSAFDNRIALVTGASRGIGRASAVALARQGAHVIATASNQGALEELDDEITAATGESATLVPLDLKDGNGVDRLGAAIHERWGRLDVLVAAAAVLGPLTPVAHLDVKDWAKVMAINLTAQWRLIRSMDPLLRASDAGRAVFLTSGVARTPRAFWGAYAASKAALETLVAVWADEVDRTPIRAAMLNPGATATRMRAEAFPGEDPAALPRPEEVAALVVELCRPDREPPAGVVDFRAATGWTAPAIASDA